MICQKTHQRFCPTSCQFLRSTTERRIVSGDRVSEILETIQSEDIDLVIMGTHGRKGLEHMILGSVAENVMRKSRVPVLIINPYKS